MGRILLVDGDNEFLELARISIEEKVGVEVICASGGNEAIFLLKKGGTFDLIISEYVMPKGTGLDLLNFKISQKSSTPFFFFTHAKRIEIPYSTTGFIGVFGKMQFNQLVTSIELILRKKSC